MSNIEDHGIPDYIRRVIGNNNRLLYPTVGLGYGPSTRTTELLNNYEREVRRLEAEVRRLTERDREGLEIAQIAFRRGEKIAYQERVIAELTSPDYRKGWSRWETLGDRRFTKISSISNLDGRLEVFGLSTDKTLWNCWQEKPKGRWHDWEPMRDGWRVDTVTAARNLDGRLAIFVLGEDKFIHTRYQDTPGGSWGGWGVEGGEQVQTAVNIGYNPDGRIEIFALGLQGDIKHKWQHNPNGHRGGFSNWDSFGGDFKGNVSIAPKWDSSLEIFTVGKDDSVYHKWQQPGGWSDWHNLGGHIKYNAIVGSHPNGRLEVFGQNEENLVVHKWQEDLPSGRSWHDWEDFGDFKSNGLDVLRNQEGLSVYSFGFPVSSIWRRACNARGWTEWKLLTTEDCRFFDFCRTKEQKEALFIVTRQNQVQYSQQLG